MKILLIHNYYRQRGGEDVVFDAEYDLLSRSGVVVQRYTRANQELEEASFSGRVQSFFQSTWSRKSYKEIQDKIRSFQPDLVHVHNTHWLITPSVYYACQKLKVPVIRSLYNYRLLCANALMLRKGKNCRLCLDGSRWNALKHRCYNGSRLMSAAVVHMQNTHWAKKTWIDQVDGFITTNDFNKKMHVQAGINSEKIHIKPHFVESLHVPTQERGDYALYVGRVSEEKGVKVLVDAFQQMKDFSLKVIGSGPLLDELRERCEKAGDKHIEFLGFQSDEDFHQILRKAKLLVVPSICHDNFPRTIIEAFSYGVPVIASNIEGVRESIDDGRTGYLFETGSVDNLRGAINKLMSKGVDVEQISAACRDEFRKNYTKDKNLERLLEIYQCVMKYKKNSREFSAN